jgi:hypothetical protein
MTLPWEDEATVTTGHHNLDDALDAMQPPVEDTVEGEVVDDTPRALTPYEPPQHHIVTGMAMLARMSDDEFEEALNAIERGQARIRKFVERAMVKGEDYGTVPGIARPFLHLPGGEKLGLLYGLAVRQEVDRIIGDGVTSPPLAFHTRSYVHLGSLDGPVVAMGWGEANSWEDKYRYRWESPTCPNCGHELIKRKSPPQMAGKWNCPNWGGKGGCNSVFEPNDERVKPRQRVENEDPYSLAETLIQISSKRSFVASIRRATGTSGFFTQDEDSPSVRQQSENSSEPPPEADPVIKKVEGVKVAAGGKTVKASAVQVREIVALSKENDLGEAGIARLLRRVLKIDVADTKKAVSDAVKALTAEQAATLIHSIKTGEVPEESEAIAKERQFQEEATAES